MSAARSHASARRFALQAAALGASGVAAVLFAAPPAQADTPPSHDTSTGPATPPKTDSGTTAAVEKPAADPPNYGLQKIRVGVQLKDGAFAPPGYSLADAKIQVVVTEEDGTVEDPSTCTTDTTGFCPTGTVLPDQGPFADVLPPGASAVVTQLTAPTGPGLLIDPNPQTIAPCTIPADAQFPYVFCGEQPGSFVPGPLAVTEHERTALSTMIEQAGPADESPAADTTCDSSTQACETVRVLNDPGIPPKAVNDTATVMTGQSVTIHVTANDDPAGAPATVALKTKPAHGSAKVSGSDFVYTSTAPFGGVDTFTYTLTTANGTATATVTVTIKAPPVAVDDSATTAAGQPVTIDVLANDNAEGGGPMSISAVGSPGHGTAKVSDGRVVYTPADGFVGTDTFVYTAKTANGTATATVTVTVTPAPANTGVPSEQLLLGGAGLIGAGGLLLLGGRRRRRDA